MKMKLSVVTVTYNSKDSLANYFNSLEKTLPKDGELIIVDNNSIDGTAEFLENYKQKTSIKNLRIILNTANDGFSKGCNIGVEEAKGEYLLFLNPDTKVLNDSINKLLKYAEEIREFGIIAPQLLKPDGKIQASVRNLPTLTRAIHEYIFGQKNRFEEYTPSSKDPIEVEAVYGAAMLIKKETYLKVKGFDNKYFLYYEDLDLCSKMHERGLKVLYYPEAKYEHIVGFSAKNIKQAALPFGLRTLTYFIPIKQSGSIYYQVKSGNIYHGILTAYLIRLVVFLSTKIHKYR